MHLHILQYKSTLSDTSSEVIIDKIVLVVKIVEVLF